MPKGALGSGIFYLGSFVLIRSGMSLGLALLVWVIGMVAFATVATFWAYEGWTNLNVISEEIKIQRKIFQEQLLFQYL